MAAILQIYKSSAVIYYVEFRHFFHAYPWLTLKKFKYLVAKTLKKEIDPFAAASEFATSILNKGD